MITLIGNLLLWGSGLVIGLFFGIWNGFNSQRKAKYKIGQCVVCQQGTDIKKTGVILQSSVQCNRLLKWDIYDWVSHTEYSVKYQIDLNHGRISYDVHSKSYPKTNISPVETIWIDEKDILGAVIESREEVRDND